MILFVGGTGTGVGKTTVTCALAEILRRRGIHVGVSKPVATGSSIFSGRKVSMDAVKLMRVAGRPMAEYRDVNPVLFDPPVSPHLAARLARLPIRLAALRRRLHDMEKRFELLLVEGIGGMATPLTDRSTWADFVSEFPRSKTLLVCSPKLGTLNHTLLSLEYLAHRKISCPFLVLSNYDPAHTGHRQNRAELARLTRLPVLVCDRRGMLGDQKSLNTQIRRFDV